MISLLVTLFIANTGETLSSGSDMKFESVEQCESFVLMLTEGSPYYRNDEGLLIVTETSTGNVITVKCYEE